MQTPSSSQEAEDELIPTAIVIKNIPFAVKKEQLVQLMTDMNLPLPYAFNYHFDNGVFRGLAFANFTSAEETATVIEVLNHFELQGRKLRVEYKKMLPLQERERIEREKRERRGQLEEQHRPMAASQLQTQSSMSSLTSHIPATSPSPVSQRGPKLGTLRMLYFLIFLKLTGQSRQRWISMTARRSSFIPSSSYSKRTQTARL
jgi:RNA recognition motif-containing protein